MFFEEDISSSLIEESPDSNTPERLEIDSQIDSLYEQIHLLRSRRNTLAPISRLPAELLSRIFFIVQGLYLTETEDYYGWTAVIRVSQYWRAVVMERSDMWGGVIVPQSYRLPPWSPLSFTRSGTSKLDVSFQNVNPNASHCKFIISVLDELSRIRSLGFSPSRGYSYANALNMQKIVQCFEQPAPHLEELSLGSNDNGAWFWFSQFSPTFRLFNGDAPMLRSLTLINSYIDWDNPLFRNLHHLKLHGLPSPHFTSLHNIFDVLENAPNLQTLQMVSSVSLPDPEPFPPHDNVALASLSSLDIMIPRKETLAFLSTVTLPAQSHIKICISNSHSYYYASHPEDYREQICSALTACRTDAPHDIDRLNFAVNQRNHVYTDIQLGSESTSTDNSTTRRTISIQVPTKDYNAWLMACTSIPFSQLRSLYLWFQADEAFEKTGGSLDFTQMPLLAEVTAQGPFIHWFLYCIELHPHSFPSLESITLRLSVPGTPVDRVLTAINRAFKRRREVTERKLKIHELNIIGVDEVFVKSEFPALVENVKDVVDVLRIYKEQEFWLTLL
ncbi:hypothetical protein BDN72DRAFT_577379 [Pluteus cervinus]|uniref:Uncharacterized protein n=1 Tax=Pluteus cervinus TaxID=181527 RepID=A0ACD3AXA0_9AGAR|nr:hypothetical protein BDN72DRAFT_577379 [Pluteus cervinus]